MQTNQASISPNGTLVSCRPKAWILKILADIETPRNGWSVERAAVGDGFDILAILLLHYRLRCYVPGVRSSSNFQCSKH